MIALSTIAALFTVVASVNGASLFGARQASQQFTSLKFEARLATQSCGKYTMTAGQRMVIQSPNFPKPYSTDTRCQWEFSCPTETDHTLEFKCPVFELESSSDCVNDRLIVASRGQRDVKCGTNSPDGTVTKTGWARFTFFSNAKTVKQGFRCYVWCLTNPVTTLAPTIVAATTVAPTTVAATTVAATTVGDATTVAPTTVAATTVAVTTVGDATTVAPTTVAATTVAATTVAPPAVTPTTVAATTLAPTTVAVTTVAPTTVAPTTVAPTTVAPTTVAATTVAVTTVAEATTDAVTTVAPTTVAPTTLAPTTVAVTTVAVTTVAEATTDAVTTVAATTAAATTTVGFDLKTCGTYEMKEGQRMVIQSTNFPKPYTTNERCQWEFSCPTEADHVLEMVCPKFQLEDSANCANDRLIVASRGKREEKCGSNSPDGTVTSTGWARFTYFSNGSVVKNGFRCYIWCKAKPAY